MLSIVSHLVPDSFPALAFAHFMALVSPGPDFFLILGHAAGRGLRGAAGLCAGIAAGNAVYVLVAAAGWSFAKDYALLYRCLEWAGAVYLVWLGCLLVRSGRHPAGFHVRKTLGLPLGRQFLLGLASALLNPKNAVFYLTLMTVIVGAEATPAQQAFCGVWMVGLVLAWDLAVAAGISLPAVQRVVQRKVPVIESVSGVCLIGLAFFLVLLPALRGA